MKTLFLIIYVAGMATQLTAAPAHESDDFAQFQKIPANSLQKLTDKKWSTRQAGKNELSQILEAQPKTFLKYYFYLSTNSKDPEIRMVLKDILRDYYRQHIYNPDKKPGFIGIQLGAVGEMEIKGTLYTPIAVVIPIPGYPGSKAGLKANDLIIEVDKYKCSDNFGVDEFISYIASKSPGEKVILKILSKDKVLTKTVILAERPASQINPSLKKSFTTLFQTWYNLHTKNR